MATPTKHLAAIIAQKGTPLTLVERPTPQPGPKQLLIRVRAIAINPVDYYQREWGSFIENFPSVTGYDMAGTVAATGGDLSPNTTKTGARVVAYGGSFWHNAEPDYGAYQEYVLVDEELVALLPDSYSFTEGSVFPMAARTTWDGWLWTGIPQDVSKAPKKQALLVWGASSSMGAFAVQEGKLMGYSVYATASPRHHEYLKSLGATRVFDYSSETVAAQIVDAAKADGVAVPAGLHATGSQQLALDVMGKLRGDASSVKLGIIPIPEADLKVPDGVEWTFVVPPTDAEERKERCRWIFTEWLQEKLAARQLVASPHIKVVEGGLKSANKALDEWKAGVSATKLVLEL